MGNPLRISDVNQNHIMRKQGYNHVLDIGGDKSKWVLSQM